MFWTKGNRGENDLQTVIRRVFNAFCKFEKLIWSNRIYYRIILTHLLYQTIPAEPWHSIWIKLADFHIWLKLSYCVQKCIRQRLISLPGECLTFHLYILEKYCRWFINFCFLVFPDTLVKVTAKLFIAIQIDHGR